MITWSRSYEFMILTIHYSTTNLTHREVLFPSSARSCPPCALALLLRSFGQIVYEKTVAWVLIVTQNTEVKPAVRLVCTVVGREQQHRTSNANYTLLQKKPTPRQEQVGIFALRLILSREICFYVCWPPTLMGSLNHKKQ